MPLDFVKFARAKGVSEGRIVSVHVLKNILIPIVTVVGVEFGSLIAFAIVTETIFAWPGMGKLLIDSIMRLDRPVDRRLPARGRDVVHRHQFRGRHPLFAARSAHPAGERGMTAIRSPKAELRTRLVGRAFNGLLKSPKATVAAIVLPLLLLAPFSVRGLRRRTLTTSCRSASWTPSFRPGSESMTGGIYWLGTDGQGRDMVSAMIYGLRTSLAVGVVSGVVALGARTSLGLIAAYFGGRIDTLIMRLVDLMLGFPTILVALMLLAAHRAGRRQGHVRAGAGAMGAFRPCRAQRGAGGAAQGIRRGGSVPRSEQGTHPLRSPAAELPAAAHRDRDTAGGERDFGGGDAELPRNRSADHRAIARAFSSPTATRF